MNHQKINSKPSHYSGIMYYGKSFTAHFHNSYELICVLKGNLKVTVNTKDIYLHETDFLLISPCMTHSISDNSDSVFFIAIVSADQIPDFFETHKKSEIYLFSVEDDTFAYLQNHLFQEEMPAYFRRKACLYMLLSYAEQGKCFSPTSFENYDFILTINSYIAEHFQTPVTRAELAKLTGYEEHYFSHLFRKNFGLTLCQYVNSHRISHALTLLSTTPEKISCIALECGFSSVKDFNNAFLRQLGQTPSEYRRKSLSTRIV